MSLDCIDSVIMKLGKFLPHEQILDMYNEHYVNKYIFQGDNTSFLLAFHADHLVTEILDCKACT